MTQLTYRTTLDIGKVGYPAKLRDLEYEALTFEERHQTDTLTVANEENGAFTVVLEGETVSYTDTDDASDTVTAAGIAAAINAAAAVTSSALNNLLVATSAAAVVTITTLRKGESYTVGATTAPGSATLTHANTQSSTQTALPLGIVVARSGDHGLARVASTSTSESVAGFVAGGDNEDEAAADGTSGGYSAGKSVPVAISGDFYASPEDSVTRGGKVYVRRVATGTEVLGALRGSHDGTARVETITPTAANSTQYHLRIDVDHDGNGDWKSYVISALSDADGTATEIVTALKADLAKIDALSGVVTGSGTTTLVLTGAAGIKFESNDIGTGTLSVAETTAGAFDTFVLKGAKWDLAASAAGTSIVKLNRAAA